MRILAIAAALLWGLSPVRAQGGPEGAGEGGIREPGWPSPEMRGPGRGEPPENPLLAEDFAQRLSESLRLSGDQRAKVAAILAASRPGLKKRSQDIKDLQNRMKALHDEMRKASREVREKIRAELDAEQKERFDSLRPPPSDGGWGGMRRRPGPPEAEDAQGGARGEGRDMPPPEMWRSPGQGGDGSPTGRPPGSRQ